MTATNEAPSPIPEPMEEQVASWRELLDRSDVEIAALRAQIRSLKLSAAVEADTLRHQLATVGFAAVGVRSALSLEPDHPYHSHALVDVVRLRREVEDQNRRIEHLKLRREKSVLRDGAGI